MGMQRSEDVVDVFDGFSTDQQQADAVPIWLVT
jgi:hypothetical protein